MRYYLQKARRQDRVIFFALFIVMDLAEMYPYAVVLGRMFATFYQNLTSFARGPAKCSGFKDDS